MKIQPKEVVVCDLNAVGVLEKSSIKNVLKLAGNGPILSSQDW